MSPATQHSHSLLAQFTPDQIRGTLVPHNNRQQKIAGMYTTLVVGIIGNLTKSFI